MTDVSDGVLHTLFHSEQGGHEQVVLCQDRNQFDDLANLLDGASAGADFLFQRYIKASHGRDVRVLVIDGKVVAAMERRAKDGGFKSNIALGGVGRPFNPSAEMAELALKVAHELKLDERRVRRYRQAAKAPLSLDAPIGDDESNSISEVVADPNAALPYDRLVTETDTDLVREVLAKLPERENTILSLRFGLSDGRERTLEEIGDHFGLTRERIRQIQEQALKKLRAKMEARDNVDANDSLAFVA